MKNFRSFSTSTGLAALLAAGIIVLGSADLAAAKGGGGGGGGGNGGGNSHSSFSSSMSRSSGSSSKPAFVNTIHPIISKGGSNSKHKDRDDDHKYSDKHDGKHKHANKDHDRDHDRDYDKHKDKPPVIWGGNPPRSPGSGTPPTSKPPGDVVVRDHRGEPLPGGFERLPSGQVVRARRRLVT